MALLIRCALFFLSTVLSIDLAARYREFTSDHGTIIKARIIEVNGEQVTIERADGKPFTILISRFSQDDQRYIDDWNNQNRSDVGFKTINQALGVPLLGDGNLWDDASADVARRLNWPQESSTATQSSYRYYPRSAYLVLGAHAYSSVLYAKKGWVTQLSLVFANKGDALGQSGSRRVDVGELKQAIQKDADAIHAQLTHVLGEPDRQSYGEGTARRRVLRWDWSGHAFLLSEEAEEYVSLSIESVMSADAKGKVKPTRDSILKEEAVANVKTRDNGDVIITNIPMVNQGPKGYCVPATFERCMRYMDIPADMYLLAMTGQTRFGGGTYVDELIDGVKRDISRKGRSMKTQSFKLSTRALAKYIKKGLPIIWQHFSTDAFNSVTNANTKQRRSESNLDKRLKQIKGYKKEAKQIEPDFESGHVALIIGYNEQTDEMAVSDSWGPEYEERWVPIDVAKKISGEFYVIGF